MLHNKFTGERLGVFKTPQGDHILRKPNGFEEWHRGTLAACREAMERIVSGMPMVWEWDIPIQEW